MLSLYQDFINNHLTILEPKAIKIPPTLIESFRDYSSPSHKRSTHKICKLKPKVFYTNDEVPNIVIRKLRLKRKRQLVIHSPCDHNHRWLLRFGVQIKPLLYSDWITSFVWICFLFLRKKEARPVGIGCHVISSCINEWIWVHVILIRYCMRFLGIMWRMVMWFNWKVASWSSFLDWSGGKFRYRDDETSVTNF